MAANLPAMPYHVRILSPRREAVAFDALSTTVARLGCGLSGDRAKSDWSEIEVTNASGEALFVIERSEVLAGSLAQEEIAEFRKDIRECLPKSGSRWLGDYLPSVRTIYTFQLLGALDHGNGWAAFGSVKDAVWNAAGGVIHADGEGFSNDEGYHILWQFSETVSGEWWVAVLQSGVWARFKIDLGNPLHRAAFKAGEIPFGVERA
jgi:hypothetical protein